MTAVAGLSRIGQISMRARDLDRAVRFYRDTLGLKFLFAGPNMSFFDCGSIRLMLSLPSEPKFDHPASTSTTRVADIHATHDVLASRGVHFDQPPHFVAQLGCSTTTYDGHSFATPTRTSWRS